jgi:hypothetical protein
MSIPARTESAPVDAVSAHELEELVRSGSLSRLGREAPYLGERPHAHLWADVQATLGATDAQSAVVLKPDSGRPCALCVLRTPEWDREHFGYPLGRIEYLVAVDAEAAAAAARWALERLEQRRVRVACARLPAEDLTAIGALQEAGFEFREHVLTPWRSWTDWQHRGFDVTRPTRPEDLPTLCRIARATFRTDHFHKDRRFGKEAADGVYSKWIASWHDDPPSGGRSRVTLVDGRVSGFFMYRFLEPSGVPGRTVTDLVLGGMDPEVAGKGNGYRMYCDVMDDAAAHTDYGRVTIVTSNVPVVNLYLKLGFRVSTGGEVTLHRWAGEGREQEAQ